MSGCRHTVALAALGAALASVAAGWLWRLHSRPSVFSHPERRRCALHKQAFVLMVSISFPSDADKAAFLGVWARLAAYVRAQEPSCLAFELLQSDASMAEVLVYERFVSKDYYQQVHRTSPAMQAFKAALPAIRHELQGRSFLESNVGFLL